MKSLLFLNIGISELLIILIVISLSIIPLILMAIAFIDLFKRNFKYNSLDRLLLGLLILFAPFLGSLIYLITIRKHFPLKIETFYHEKI